MWGVIRNVINNCKPSKLNESFSYINSIITDKTSVSNKFNEYFVNVGKTLAAQIPMSGPSFHSYLSEANKESIFLTPTDQQEIHSIILNMKDSAPGHDGLSAKVINPVIETLLPPLTYITNLSFTQGVFSPMNLKLPKFYHCTKIMILCSSTTIDPYRFSPSFQNYLRGSCIID